MLRIVSRTHRGTRRVALLGCCLGLLAGLPALAGADPVSTALDAQGNGAAPMIAYDASSAVTYVAWTEVDNPDSESATDYVDLCELAANTTTCAGGAPVRLTDPSYAGQTQLTGLTVLPGGRVVITAGLVNDILVEGGTVAWESVADGATFLASGGGLANGGAITSPIDGIDDFIGDTVALNSTDVGILGPISDKCAATALIDDDGLGTGTAVAPVCHDSNAINYARAGMDSSGVWDGGTDLTGNSVAAEPAAASGKDVIVAVGYTNENTPSGCSASGDTGYGAVVATVDGASTAGGTVNGSGLPAYGVLSCAAGNATLASGGEAGIGVLEGEGRPTTSEGPGVPSSLTYRPFDATATGGSFGAPVTLGDVGDETTDATPAGFEFGNLDLAEDSGDGVYAIWDTALNLYVDYSADGGVTWGAPTQVPDPPALPDGAGPGDAEIVGTGGGNVELAYTDATFVGADVARTYIESFNYQALLASNNAVTVTDTQFAGNQSGDTLTVPAGTTGFTDLAVLSGANTPDASGTATYGLYSSSSCSAQTEVFSGGEQTVDGGQAQPSTTDAAALPAGTYYWQATYSGDANDTAASSPCGSEVLTVLPAGGSGSGSTGSGSSGLSGSSSSETGSSGTSAGTGATGTTGVKAPAPAPTISSSITPTAKDASLGGLSTGKPKFSVIIAKSAAGAKFSSLTVTLPKGLSFLKAGLKKGLTISGASIKAVSLTAGKLTLTFKAAASTVKITVSARALADTAALRAEAKRHKITSLVVSLLTRAGTRSTTLKLTFKKPS